jgi:two-component system, NarL family, response regulator NreC
MAIRVLVADDHGVVRAGLRALLNEESDLEVVGEAENGEQAVRQADALRPDVVLMDVSMRGGGGIEATRAIRERHPAMRVLILTVHDESSMLQEAVRAGAAGYIIKGAVEQELMSAIRAVARGDMYVHPAMTRALLTGTRTPMASPEGQTESAQEQSPATEAPSPREARVLGLVARGHTNRQIAELLDLSVRTVETHRANLMAKLGLHSRAELVRYAADRGLLDLNTD